MSSAEAMVDETVVAASGIGRGRRATRSAAVLAALAVTQVTWLAAIIYGAVWLLT
ncbi:MAG TPA: hypothetical protein VGI77_10540 [Gaiellaceae bacterium]